MRVLSEHVILATMQSEVGHKDDDEQETVDGIKGEGGRREARLADNRLSEGDFKGNPEQTREQLM